MAEKIKSYIFITTEGYTFQPDSISSEPDIENCQVIGFSSGINAKAAFEHLINENSYLKETSFDELICYELKNHKYHRYSKYFHLSTMRDSNG